MAGEGIYKGAMYADGEGNLRAGEGEYEGERVAFHDGSYVFISDDEPSHNERHEQNTVDVEIDYS